MWWRKWISNELVFFFCVVLRATWFTSHFALRVNDLPLDFATTLPQLTKALDEQQIIYFTNTLWCVWKARNGEIFSGKNTPPRTVLIQAAQMRFDPLGCMPKPRHMPSIPIQIPRSTCVLLMDASWDTHRRKWELGYRFLMKGYRFTWNATIIKHRIPHMLRLAH